MVPHPTRADTYLAHPRYWPAWFGVALFRILSLLPLRLLWLIGATLGQIAYYLPIRERRVADRNIELCFPELDERARHQLVRRHFRAMGQALLALGVAWWGSDRRLQRLVRLRNLDYLDAAIASGRQVILLAPHFLALDIGGIRVARERLLVSMYKASKDPVGDYLLRRRTRYKTVMVERDAPLKQLIRLIREGRPFYYLPDQDPGGATSTFVPFFGIPAATVTALSRIARMTNAVVIPCYTRQLPRGAGYEVTLHPPLECFPGDDDMADSARMNAEIEAAVRAMPEQYMWTYKRFKTRPVDEASLYA